MAVPGAPSITMPASDVDDKVARFAVTAGSGATSHTFHASVNPGFTPGPANEKQTLGATPTEALATDLNPNTETYFVLVAVNAEGSTPSPEVNEKTAPAKPTGMVVIEVADALAFTPSGGGVGNSPNDTEVWRRVQGATPWTDFVGNYRWDVSYPQADTVPATVGVTYEYTARVKGPEYASGWGPIAEGTLTAATGMMFRRRRSA